jgi:hypothetical protein
VGLELRADETMARLDDDRKLELAGVDERTLATLELAGATLEVTAPPEHTAPVITGTCAALPPLLPCTPNSILEPTAILLFQLSGAAEYGLEPDSVAFQLLVTRVPSL